MKCFVVKNKGFNFIFDRRQNSCETEFSISIVQLLKTIVFTTNQFEMFCLELSFFSMIVFVFIG